MMELRRDTDARAFRARVGPFLEAREAEHCVQIGLLAARSQQTGAPRPIYLAEVHEGGTTIAVAVMTPPYNLLISYDAPADAVRLIAADLVGNNDAVRGVMAPQATSRLFAETWRDLTGQTFRQGYSERLYRLTHVIPVPGVPGHMRPITEADRPLLRAWLRDFEIEALGSQLGLGDIDERIDRYLTLTTSGLYLWEDAGVAVALTGHTGPTPHGMRVGPVYTPPEHRGHGYASALVAALSQQLLDDGRRFCFLFTDLANPTSNHIYQTIGYEPVADVQEYVFAPEVSQD